MLSGIILAGGPSRRMGGENKSLLRFGNEALIERQVRLMKEVCSEIIVVTNTPKLYLRLVDESVRIITDYIPNKGPLSGMHAGLTLAQNDYAWIVGCDMPFISPVAAALMLQQLDERSDVILPDIQGKIYPLHAIYNRKCVKKIWKLLTNQDIQIESLQRELICQKALDAGFLIAGVNVNFVTDVNTLDEYHAISQNYEEDHIHI